MTQGKVVDLFCGAGGASLGFVKAGYEIVGAVDADPIALETYESNLCGEGSLDEYSGKVSFDEPLEADLSRDYEDNKVDEDLRTVTFQDIREYFGLSAGEVDIICGCPPCQNFSSLRDTEPWPEDQPKDNLLRAFVEFVEEEVPEVVFFENVRNILNAGDENPTTYIDWLKRSMGDIVKESDSPQNGGYGVALDVLNAADYGVPQRRKRTIGLFVYGYEDDEVSLPSPTHTEDATANADLKEWISVNEAFSQADSLYQGLEAGEKQVGLEGYPDDKAHRARAHHPSTIERMEAIRKRGDSWRDLEDTEDENLIVEAHQGLEKGASASYGIIDGERPAPTLTTRCTTPSCGRFTHPQKNRAITFREAAILMTFPRWFKLPSTNDDSERIVGNAVPPDLIQSLASRVSQSSSRTPLETTR
ncbi:DNA cytosine methyltransferase [Halosimplex marinum]|uniref:DNA cytosine methyltransferase n=1 Tax=Halosimplex marinum TaxID=3396620 RepID=UPI003F560724